MAKLQRYESSESFGYIAPDDNGNYIKVSELRGKLELLIQGKEKYHPYQDEYEKGCNDGYAEACRDLLAAIDTEEK